MTGDVFFEANTEILRQPIIRAASRKLTAFVLYIRIEDIAYRRG